MKMFKKWEKTGFTRNAMISKPMKIFDSTYVTTFLKPVSKLSKNFKLASFELTEKITHQTALQPDRVGSVHHGYRLNGQKETLYVP